MALEEIGFEETFKMDTAAGKDSFQATPSSCQA